jgi:hypothetical protein
MSDTTGPDGANGAPRNEPRSNSTSGVRPGPGDARIAPELTTLGDDLTRELDNGGGTPKDMAPSQSGEVSSEKAATMAKAKSTTTRSAAARSSAGSGRARTAASQPGASRPAAQDQGEGARPAPSLSEEDSILLAGIDRAEAEAVRLRGWAELRRREAHDTIRTHPLGSSVVVFAAGMIFGLLLARR